MSEVTSWNPPHVERVHGSDGFQFRPGLELNGSVDIWVGDFFRAVTLRATEEVRRGETEASCHAAGQRPGQAVEQAGKEVGPLRRSTLAALQRGGAPHVPAGRGAHLAAQQWPDRPPARVPHRALPSQPPTHARNPPGRRGWGTCRRCASASTRRSWSRTSATSSMCGGSSISRRPRQRVRGVEQGGADRRMLGAGGRGSSERWEQRVEERTGRPAEADGGEGGGLALPMLNAQSPGA